MMACSAQSNFSYLAACTAMTENFRSFAEADCNSAGFGPPTSLGSKSRGFERTRQIF